MQQPTHIPLPIFDAYFLLFYIKKPTTITLHTWPLLLSQDQKSEQRWYIEVGICKEDEILLSPLFFPLLYFSPRYLDILDFLSFLLSFLAHSVWLEIPWKSKTF
jgi:hypothetical protein